MCVPGRSHRAEAGQVRVFTNGQTSHPDAGGGGHGEYSDRAHGCASTYLWECRVALGMVGGPWKRGVEWKVWAR